MRGTRIAVLCFVFVVSLGCESLANLSPFAAPTGTPTTAPTPTITLTPTPDCNADQVLKTIKARLPKDEFEVYHHTIDGQSSLVLWYVNSDLNALAEEDQVEYYANRAVESGAYAVQHLARIDGCVEILFDKINPIVVDKNYNGWFSAQVSPGGLPAGETLRDADRRTIAAAFEVSYLRRTAPLPAQPAPDGSCSWQETRAKIQQHFSPERENVSFHLVIDEVGTNVWAQWDGPTDALAMASMLNITMELDCLHPTPTNLFMIVVNDAGDIEMIASLSGDAIQEMDLEQLQILYQE